METKLYEKIATTFIAYQNCLKDKNHAWKLNHEQTIKRLCHEHMPSGSGFDCGVRFDFHESTENCLVFVFDYHWMNENGFYVGWTQHELKIKPSLAFGFSMDITDLENYAEFYEENNLYVDGLYLYDDFYQTFEICLNDVIKD